MLYPGSFPLLTSAVVGWSLLTGRNEVCKEIIWLWIMNSEEKSIIVGYAACVTTNAREELFVWMENKVSPQPGKYLIAVTNSLWLAGQANMVERGATFMSKRHCYTVSICLFCSKDAKGPVKAIAKLCSVAVFSLPWGPTWERGGGTILWVQVWDCSGAAGRVGCGTDAWLKACTKSWAFALLLREEGNTLASCLASAWFQNRSNKRLHR